MFYGVFVKGTNPPKYIRYLYVFLKFWTLYRSDDGMDDGPDVVNQDKCTCVGQECIEKKKLTF